MINRALLLTLFLFIPPVIAEEAFELADYAWQARITESDSTLQYIDLSVDILKGMSQPNAIDIAVFDVNGQALPTRLRQKSAHIEKHQIALTFHQFNRDKISAHGGTLTIDQQQLDAENNQINRLAYQQQLAIKENRSDYIIELSPEQLELGINDIELEWNHQPATDFLKLTIQVANDLDHWKTIQSNKNLFNADGREGEWITLSGLPLNYRYIRLIPHQDISEFNLLKASGTYTTQKSIDDLLLVPQPELLEDKQHAGFYHFQQPLQVHAKSLALTMPAGYFLSGTLYASNKGFDKKRIIKSAFEQHNLGNIEASSAINISGYAYKDWWFKPEKPIHFPLHLAFSYTPYELQFINNQHGPYTLAWGNYEANIQNDDLSPLLKKQNPKDDMVASQVSITETLPAGGIQRQQQMPVTPWLTWLLWAFLAAAVVLTARMAFTLYRDMNQ